MGYWGEWEQYTAREWSAYLEQQLADLIRRDQQRQMIGLDPVHDLVDLVVGSLDEWYVRVYMTLMSAADTSCDNARAAALAQLTLAQQLQVVGIDIGEVWQEFHDKWTKKGVALPYTFDGLPFDFVSRLVETCDREALDACLASGDLGLLLMYVRDRTSILDLSAQPVSGVGDGSALIDRCARFSVDLDFIYAVDRTVDQIDHPLFREAERWGLQLRVDVRWKQFGADPWVGRLIGEAVPVWTGLGAQYRTFVTSQNDQGVVTGTWQPWCPVAYAIGPWKPWPVRRAHARLQPGACAAARAAAAHLARCAGWRPAGVGGLARTAGSREPRRIRLRQPSGHHLLQVCRALLRVPARHR